ncbi:MAG: glutathione S-transferase C-terminal domain-containing protein, partial [Rhizomicrobium sp.]
PGDPFVRAEARSYSAEMHSGFPDVRDQLSMDFARRKPMPELREETKAQLARIIDSWSSALTRFGKDGGFLFGGFSVADCMYAPVASRLTTYGVQLPGPVKDYVERVMALPAMRDWGDASRKEVDAGLA